MVCSGADSNQVRAQEAVPYETVVYYLENADGSNLVTVLNSVYGSGSGGTLGLNIPNQAVSIVADVGTNSLVITAPTANLEAVLEIVRKLDIAPYQVLVEAVILEVVLGKSDALGVDWSYKTTNVDFGIRAEPPGRIEAINLTGLKQAIIGNHGTLNAVIHALVQDDRTRVLATPRVFAANNRKASIMIGDEVPVKTAETFTPGGVVQRTFAFKDVGIKMTVTPHINRKRQTVLEIDQEIKTIRTVARPPGVTDENPIITSRMSSTNVILDDGQTAVLGGLIRTDRIKLESKVPLVGDLPIIGSIFRSKSESETKTEILIFLTTRVVTNSSELQEVVKEQQSETSYSEQRSKQLFGDTAGITEGLDYLEKNVIK